MNISPKDNDIYLKWEGGVYEALCEHLDCTWSDATGLCETRNSVMEMCFRDNITPKTTAINFISKSSAD
ncbi:MAG: hypothetical protein QM504_10200 [Pseudomonadota bacterium]